MRSPNPIRLPIKDRGLIRRFPRKMYLVLGQVFCFLERSLKLRHLVFRRGRFVSHIRTVPIPPNPPLRFTELTPINRIVGAIAR